MQPRSNTSPSRFSKRNAGGGNFKQNSSDSAPSSNGGSRKYSFGASSNQSAGNQSYGNGGNGSGYGANGSYRANPSSGNGGYRGNGGGNFGGNGGGYRSNSGGNRGRSFNQGRKQMDPSRFIRKADVIETTEYIPQHEFADFKVHDHLKANIAARNFVTPTPIQDQSIEHIIDGKDLVGLAETGSGKTGAFLIPLINKVLMDNRQRVMVIVPTRELAEQINGELRLFVRNMRIYSALCIGGAGIYRQISDLRRRPQFVIGTPGRLKDLYERNALQLNFFNNVVLDEADRMLDMGFVADIEFILSKMEEVRQSLFFSATMNREADLIVKKFLKEPVMVSVGKQDASKNVDQDIVRFQRQNKVEVLHELLIQEEFKKVLVFSRTKRGAEHLMEDLTKRGFKAQSIHGDKSQFKRQQALNQFKQNIVPILVATDVAARGIDVKDISHVINYDVPDTYEDYIHRIGRTGRANKKGIALTFVG